MRVAIQLLYVSTNIKKLGKIQTYQVLKDKRTLYTNYSLTRESTQQQTIMNL